MSKIIGLVFENEEKIALYLNMRLKIGLVFEYEKNNWPLIWKRGKELASYLNKRKIIGLIFEYEENNWPCI